ncbi:hypothetical protein GA0061070_104136 [Kosakonia oryziphila]|uniref:Uncharacterized protein n=1 Tax=Kosakonia oryziphila TaxID=1005667 RepID=A0A1C4FSI1_9ENTR|nr:hypothetical protein GA0061070_104136 [Kosakonia oryziphila]
MSGIQHVLQYFQHIPYKQVVLFTLLNLKVSTTVEKSKTRCLRY